MRVAYAAMLLLLLTTGCARVKPAVAVSEPASVTTQPGTPPPAAMPATPPSPQAETAVRPEAPATSQPETAATPAAPAAPQPKPAAAPPAPPTAQPGTVAKPAAPTTPQAKPAAALPTSANTSALPAASNAVPPAAKTPAAPALDLKALETRLKETKAMGLFTKIALKNQVDDLLDQFRKHYEGSTTVTMTALRRSYDLMLMKVLSLLQDDDQRLASDIVTSREAIWDLLADPKKFAALKSDRGEQ